MAELFKILQTFTHDQIEYYQKSVIIASISNENSNWFQ
jgi:hypothetical protein